MSDRSFLEEINIRAIGVIEEASLHIESGFTVFSGETGAGKTMVLTALALVLGGKVDAALVRQGKERLTASATFRVPEGIKQMALERGASVDEGVLILTRTLGIDGRSRAIAGGVNVPVNALSELGELLVEIHGQSASASLGKSSKQRELLDRFSGEEFDRTFQEYGRSLENYQKMKKKIDSLRKSASGRESEVVELREFASAYSKVKPLPHEVSNLLLEISRLSSVEALRFAVNETTELLDGENASILNFLAAAKRSLEVVVEKDPLIGEILGSISESYYLLTEAALDSHRYLSDLDMDPERLEAAQARRSEISALLRRYATTEDPDLQIEKLTQRFGEVAEKIADLSGGEARFTALEQDLEKLLVDLKSKAKSLSDLRHTDAKRLSTLVTHEIHSLSMPHTKFICEVDAPDYLGSMDEKNFSSHGCDEITMNIQTHVNGSIVPLAKGASGGELSRIMLALEVVLAQSSPVGTYIFDEVDAGVGGKAAIEVGRRLHALSRHSQVIVVTHLPQVAAWADSHFVLTKNESGAVNQSSVTQVTGEARIAEIARMLAGHETSKSAREHAAELLGMRESKN